MGGIKHNLWGNFPLGNKPTAYSNEDEWMKNMVANTTVYCGACGGQVLQSNQDTEGKKSDWEWEMQNNMHYHCYIEKMMSMRDGNGS